MAALSQTFPDRLMLHVFAVGHQALELVADILAAAKTLLKRRALPVWTYICSSKKFRTTSMWLRMCLVLSLRAALRELPRARSDPSFSTSDLIRKTGMAYFFPPSTVTCSPEAALNFLIFGFCSRLKKRSMRKSMFTEEQMVKVLKEHAAGMSTSDLCRKHGISDAAFYKRRSRYSGMDISRPASWRRYRNRTVDSRSSCRRRCWPPRR
jgi:putative transposase